MTGENSAGQNALHPTWRLCRVCTANVRNAGALSYKWLAEYNAAAKKGDFQKAADLLRDATIAHDLAALVWDDAQAACEAHHGEEETGVDGQRLARG